MSRRINRDFTKLTEFVADYSLNRFLHEQNQLLECKSMHKKLFGLMIFVAEFNQQNPTDITSIYMNEMISDLMLSLFNWVQGMYKPSKLELRCAIEEFFKSLLAIDNPIIINVRSVYEIFELAHSDRHFSGDEFSSGYLVQLKNDYSVLCQIVHSAKNTIISTDALHLLPQYNEERSEELQKTYVKIAENILSILFAKYPEIVDKMHPENKEDFLDCLSKTTRKTVNNYLFS